MLRTPMCDLLDIDVPIICAPFGPWEQVELAAAVSNAGGLGSLGTALRPLPDLKAQWERLRELTDKPFAINHTARPLDKDAFAATLRFRPAAISFHLAVPDDLIARAHDAGILWIQQVMNREQAEQAVAAGADVVIAQGGEAGGNGGWVATTVLVPQVVDVAGQIPVVAAGGIADGRGIAAALTLGAQGVSMGTRFLASTEMRIDEEWKRRILMSDALDAVKVTGSERILPPFNRPGGPAEPRALRTPLIDQLRDAPASVDPAEIVPRIVEALMDGRGHEYIPFTGQSAGLIDEILPVGQIVSRLIREAEVALVAAARAFA
ncbi:NAD(P)H-dependent flavin oxidoreductase [Nonomuraea jiangxiensis]|uniref:Nitronate monooxygenase/enoyl-[acyl-carrier protein] reductase II n=1 Tax=Nonomuraea jiangxiensis TaxID=633440 RepID=A0A1G9MNV3_9ACTN|nr:nitronate monooxygenase [Nonomuraea jiangxiensis]SDL75920.1 nitronate monooxygenase/enoyl-[acyl-carrier protein] reductase II [Nonomuraea jiangxiensis]